MKSWFAVLLLLAFASPARAADPALEERLGAETAAAVGRIVDEARAGGLPTESLVSAALEGAAKRAPATLIVETVRRRAQALGRARDALGRASTPAELVAGAGALLAGVPADTLSRLRSLRPQGSLVVPLVVVADLITRRVPEPTASAVVLHASRHGIRDRDLLKMRERVEQDIRGGRTPSAAIEERLRSWNVDFPAGPARPSRIERTGGEP